MIKETVQYTDYNDVNRTEVLYFNINQSELMDNLDLRDQLEKIQASLEGPERELTTDEVQQILNLVKRMMRLAYGVRSEDGLTFDKDEDGENKIWKRFKNSAVYDAFLMSLFKNPEKAFQFLVSVMPKDLMEQARREMGENVVELPQPGNVFETSPSDPPENPTKVDGDNVTPNIHKEWHEYSESELLELPQAHFEQLYNRIKGPKPTMLVSIAMKRRAQGN